MTTLADMTLILAEAVSKVLRGTTTATGTTTSLTDSTNLLQPNGFFDKGSLWILSGTYAGQTRQVSSYAENKLNWTTAFAAAIASGVRYAAVDPDYPYAEMVKAINNALDEIGPVLGVDTSLPVTSTKAKYTLPTGVSNVRKVVVYDPNDETNYYESNHKGEEAGMLVFDAGWQPTTDGWYLKLYYPVAHPDLAGDTDPINWGVDIERLKWTAAVELLRWGLRQYGDDERKIPQFLQDAIQNRDALSRRFNKGLPNVVIHAAR